jgi:hypothetical protein
MSRYQYLLLCDVTADAENTASSNVACWTVFTVLLPGNALVKSVTIQSDQCFHKTGQHEEQAASCKSLLKESIESKAVR